MADAQMITALGQELLLDPVGLGYAAHVQVNWQDEANALADLALINALTRVVDVPTLSGSQLFEAIDNDEWDSRTAAQKSKIQLIVSLGDNIQIAPGTKARAMLSSALADDGGNGAATVSLAALGVLGSKTVSRAEELGFGALKAGHIQLARRETP